MELERTNRTSCLSVRVLHFVIFRMLRTEINSNNNPFRVLLIFTYFLVEQISDSLQYVFENLNCLILSIQKFRTLTVFQHLSIN